MVKMQCETRSSLSGPLAVINNSSTPYLDATHMPVSPVVAVQASFGKLTILNRASKDKTVYMQLKKLSC